jgi:diamine N-acetyltransferase
VSVELRPVTQANFGSVINLEVSQDQLNFVASNLYSIAESKVYPECIPLVVYANDTVVGFLMYAFDNKDASYWVCRLMIDRYFQGKGYGMEAMRQIIQEIRKRPNIDLIKLSINPYNQSAEKLYTLLGFEKTGEMVEGEEVMCLRFETGS